MSYNQATIYFTSGTGNSFRVASHAKKLIGEQCPDTKLVSMQVAKPAEEIGNGPESLLGIVNPTHAFTAPWHVIKFVMRLPRRKATNAFVIMTRAGLKFGNVFTPGISGSGTFLIALVLALKGYKVRGILSVDMPSNWISFHPGFKESSARAIIERAKPKTSNFLDKILSGETSFASWSNLWELLWGIALLQVSLGFLLFGRIGLGKLFFANNDCNGCGICEKNCPVGAVKLHGKSKQTPYWSYRCENCMRCMAFCPKRAIEAGHSWLAIVIYITSIPAAVYLFTWLKTVLPETTLFDNAALKQVAQFLYMYPSLFLAYAIFYLLMRLKPVNLLFTYTTLTKVYRRYHEPDTKLKDISYKRDSNEE